MSAIDWQDKLYYSNDVNECYDNLISIVTACHNTCFPLIRQSRRAFRDKKWISKEIKISSRKKEMLFKTWLVSKSDIDESNYQKYKTTYRKILRKPRHYTMMHSLILKQIALSKYGIN